MRLHAGATSRGGDVREAVGPTWRPSTPLTLPISTQTLIFDCLSTAVEIAARLFLILDLLARHLQLAIVVFQVVALLVFVAFSA